MYNAGIILAEKDEERERAAKLLQNALALRREHLDRFSTDIADTLYKLGKMQSPECEGQETRQMFTEAEGIYNRQERHKDKAACLSELGHLTLGTNMDKSLSYYKKAWAIYRAHDLERHGEAANILYGIGFIHNQKLEFKQSADLLKECLKIRIREEGKNSLDVGKTCEQLGSCLLSLGQHEDALKLYVTSLEIYKDIYGESAVPCARVMLDIATLYSYKHQFDLVLVQLMACLEFMENHHGKESEEVATVLLRIGQVHDMRVDNEEAMKCVSRALEIRIKLYTKEDIRVAETYLICGKVLEDWGDIDEVRGCTCLSSQYVGRYNVINLN
jgi:tetratricopeptide (TPR) repeat protein